MCVKEQTVQRDTIFDARAIQRNQTFRLPGAPLRHHAPAFSIWVETEHTFGHTDSRGPRGYPCDDMAPRFLCGVPVPSVSGIAKAGQGAGLIGIPPWKGSKIFESQNWQEIIRQVLVQKGDQTCWKKEYTDSPPRFRNRSTREVRCHLFSGPLRKLHGSAGLARSDGAMVLLWFHVIGVRHAQPSCQW